MEISNAIFYLLSTLIISSAVLAVGSRKIFRAAIYLLFCMMSIAGLYFWMQYEFVAAVQVVVYVGGIVVLIIFSIFLTHHVGSEMEEPTFIRSFFSFLASVLGFALCFVTIKRADFVAIDNMPAQLTANRIGEQMLSLNEHGYILPFEVISMLLLAAMVGCIVIAIKQPARSNSPYRGGQG